eukprot:1124000-Ditylum_brightwellii.AAC.1
MVEANYKVQIKPSKPSIVARQNHIKTNTLGFKFVPANLPYDKSIHDRKQHYTSLLKEPNQYLANYKDFCISGISNEMISREFDGKTLCDHLELQGVVGDITHTIFTETKGVWQVETSKTQVVEAMHHVTEILDKGKSSFSDKEKKGTQHSLSLVY